MGAKNILLGWVHMKKLNDEYKRLMQEAKYYLQEAEDKNEKLQKIFDEIKVNVLAKSVLDSCLNAIEATIRACIIAVFMETMYHICNTSAKLKNIFSGC